ncbi:MAG: hypothetical protein PVF54_04035 [Anaerolineae bacterium]
MHDNLVREQLVALLRGGNAHMSFGQAVADFPAEARNATPPNLSCTPCQLLEHVRIAQWDILQFIRNPDHVSPECTAEY